MNAFENATRGLPSLAGVLVGMIAYQHGWLGFCGLLAPITLGGLALLVGWGLIGKYPRIGCILIGFWTLSAVSVVAVCTIAIVAVSVNAPAFISLEGREQDAVVGGLVGAITTFLAIAWTNDIEKASGVFWASTQFKNALQSKIAPQLDTSNKDTQVWEAVNYDRVQGGPRGWGIFARWARARIFSKYFKKIRKA